MLVCSNPTHYLKRLSFRNIAESLLNENHPRAFLFLAGALFGLGLERIISVELALPQVTFFVVPGSADPLRMSHSPFGCEFQGSGYFV